MLPDSFYTFLQAVGYGILHSFWQAALVWMMAEIAGSSRSVSSVVKYKVYSAAQVIIFISFISTVWYFGNNSAVESGGTFSGGSGSPLISGILIENLLPYLSAVYFLLLFVFMVRWISVLSGTMKIRNTPNTISYEWIESFVERNKRHLKLKRKVCIILSEKIKTALTVGFIRPVILIPLASLNHLTAHQLEAVLMHELAHVKRSDYLVNLLHSLVEQILYFNPFVKVISRRIKAERENICDDFVIEYNYNRAHYADALVKMARFNSNQLVMPASAKGQPLLNRIARLLNKKTPHRPSINWFTAGCLAILLFSIASYLSIHRTANLQPLVKSEKSQALPMITSLEFQAASVNYTKRLPAGNETKQRTEEAELKNAESHSTAKVSQKAELPVESKVIAREEPLNEPAPMTRTVGLIDSLQALNLITPAVYQQFPADMQEMLELQKANPTDFIVIVQEDEATKSSAHKLITIQIIANNGMVKTYKWTIDVYQ